MRTLPFLLVTVVSGAIAGTILGLINLGVVEPFIDKAIELEMQNDIQAGQTVNINEITDYRTWQKVEKSWEDWFMEFLYLRYSG